MSKKFKCRPSKIAAYAYCPGMAVLDERIEPEPPNQAMLEGTRAHHIAAKCLKAGVWKTSDLEFKRTPAEILKNIDEYLDMIRERTGDQPDSESRTEKKVFGKWIHKNLEGTPDHVIMNHSATWSIIDLKYGQGHMVEACENLQLAAYALMILGEKAPPECKALELIIFQPRATHGEKLKIWNLSPSELYEVWLPKIQDTIRKVENKVEEFNPGPGCADHFCNCAHICPAIKKLAYDNAVIEFEKNEITLPEPAEFTQDDMGKFLLFESVYSKWSKSCYSKCLEYLENGGEIPGYKLVLSKTNRKLKPEMEHELEKYFGDEAFDYKPKGISSLEKLFKSKSDLNFDDFIFKPEGKPTIAPESDKRPALNINLEASKRFSESEKEN